MKQYSFPESGMESCFYKADEVDALIQRLKNYGLQHQDHCDLYMAFHDGRCDCGLEALKKELGIEHDQS
jgi:hypothetical protein